MTAAIQRTVLYDHDFTLLPRLLRAMKWMFYLGLLAGLAVVACLLHGALYSLHYFPILSVKVNGQFQYTDRDAIQTRTQRYASRGFFGMDTSKLRRELSALPWVSDVNVKRLWADSIVLTVIEHQPVARWNGNALLTRSGSIIEPPQLQDQPERVAAWRQHFSSLPELNSQTHDPSALWAQFLKADQTLRQVGVELQRLDSDQRQALTLFLVDGVAIRLGRHQFEQRLTRFVAVYTSHILPLIDEVAYVDLRYPNGFAIGSHTELEN